MKIINSNYQKLIILLIFFIFNKEILSRDVKININKKNIKKIYNIFKIYNF